MKKRSIIVLAATAVVLAATMFLVSKTDLFKKRPIAGELKILSYAPQGAEVPIATDGVTVMFDRAVVPLTTLDEGRERKFPLKITPDINGKFFWLGTHGFIFRPDEPLDPATTYKVELPAFSWEFSTVTPKVLTWEPSENQTLLPKSASFFLRFNIAMNRKDVEKRIEIVDAATGQPLLMKRSYGWGDDGHTLRVSFKQELPWESQIKVTLPKGVLGKKGDLGLGEPVTVTYLTPGKKMTVEKVTSYSIENAEEVVFRPGKEFQADAGSGICFYFSQAILKKSFEKGFHVESDDKGKKPQPYFYFADREIFSMVGSDGKLTELEGYKQGCAAFLDDYNRSYTFWIEPEKIESLSGAPLTSGKEKYLARTGSAAPALASLLTKNILSHKGPLKIPYRGTNLKSVTVRLYRWNDKAGYDESLKSARIQLTKEAQESPTPVGQLDFGRVSVPFDPATMTIDQGRMPADIVQEIPLNAPPDSSTRFLIDLGSLPTPVSPGIYLVEVFGSPSVEPKKKNASDLSAYSMIQITPVGIALKREVDRILVWTTDLESGAPLPNLPVHVTLNQWNSQIGANQEIAAQDATTNGQGVAILPLLSPEGARACVEVTQAGSESYSCETDHWLTSYRETLRAGPHYFAYAYTDRPIYRPGQKVFFSSFIRQVKEGRYFMPAPDTPVAVTVTDAAGQTIFSNDKAVTGPGGVVSGAFTLEEGDDIPRGEYNIAFSIGQQRFSRVFFVASYRKPSFKIDLKTSRPEIVSGEDLKVEVQGSYFFGAPLRKSKAAWSIMTTTYLFSPEGYEAFSFLDEDLLHKKPGEEGEEYFSDYEYDIVASSSYTPAIAEDESQYDNPRAGAVSEGGSSFFKDPENKKVSQVPEKLDEKGLLTILYRPDLRKYPTSQRLTVEASVQDPSRQEVSGAEDIVVHKGEFYLGVRPEKWVYGTKDKAKIELVSLDTSGRPAGRKKFSVDVVKRDYKFIERRTARGYWELLFEPQDTKIKTLSGKTDGNGKGEVSFTIPEGGTFRLVAKGTDGKGNEIQSATTVYAWGEGYVPWRLDEPEKIELTPDKDSYKVGETAKILVKSLVPVTKGLMTLERGRLLEYKIIDLGGNASHIEIPVTEGMIPNLYLSLVAHVGRTLERGMAAPTSPPSPPPGPFAPAEPDAHGGSSVAHPPLLYHGETEIRVEPESKRLNVMITPDRTGDGEAVPIYRPGETVKVKIQTKNPAGKPKKAHVIVSVADESVLRLLNYQLPDLIKKFYYRRPNSVVTASSLLSLKAGDSGTGAGKKRRIFKDTAHFEAHLATNDQGEAEFSFKLPDDLTTWVIEALAISESFTAGGSGLAEPDPPLASPDNTYVGGSRGKIMTTLPLVLRAALPRFAVWGDRFQSQIIANNRNPDDVEGRLAVKVAGDGILKGEKDSEEFSFSIPPHEERAFPVELSIRSATGRMIFSAEAKDEKGGPLDALEVSIPVEDRYAPEVTATSGWTQTEEKEQIDLPPDLSKEKGGLDVSFKASLALAAAPSLKTLFYFPYGCSEQKSATLIALLMAREMTNRFGEGYLVGLDAKLAPLDEKINLITEELIQKFQAANGGIKYWPESEEPNFFTSVQTLWALTMARGQGFSIDETARENLKKYVLAEIQREKSHLDWDAKAYGVWGLTLDGTSEYNLIEDLVERSGKMSISGLSYLLMAIKNGGGTLDPSPVQGRLKSFAKQEPRHTSWPASDFFWSSAVKNTALAGEALLVSDPLDPNVPRALAFLLNRKRAKPCFCTQDNLYLASFVTEYAKRMNEEKTDFKATLIRLAPAKPDARLKSGGESGFSPPIPPAAAEKTLMEKSFDQKNLLSVEETKIPMKDLAGLPMPVDLTIAKRGDGTLYYDMVLKYYLPPEKTPTREEGLIVSREYYSLDDIKEEAPLTTFKVGENYKGHIVLVAPQEMNFVIVQDLLPAGFEPIDMTLAITSRAADLMAGEGGAHEGGYEGGYDEERFTLYDDVVVEQDYGTDYAFQHQEIRDDAIVWSDETIPPGVYHIRYPVRATTAGTFLMPGAVAFEFYEPEIFGRSRTRVVEVKE
jgi:uncharacterized protein YfaS (alpha-2-macroglobulin family)